MDLADALAAEVTAASPAVRAEAERLRTVYRSGAAPDTLALTTRDAALAYAAYRMPATYAAARAALAMAPPGIPRPDRHLDLGGGTGATVWAVGEHWGNDHDSTGQDSTDQDVTGPGLTGPDVTRCTRSTVLDASTAALEAGARIAARGSRGQDTIWSTSRFTGATVLPAADFVSASYLLGELDETTADRLVAEALRVADLLLVLEPGTPRGFGAIRRAREQVRAAGWHLLAPCPHALGCPILPPDWCHFAVRLPRSAVHRALKEAERGFEDEKFSFVLAAREQPRQTGTTAAQAELAAREQPRQSGTTAVEGGRILRHPVQRKGLVQFRTCEPDGATHERIVSKRQGPAYRAARDLAWGDLLPLPPTP